MSGGGGGGGGGLMSCVREGSLEPPYRPPHVEQNTHAEGRTGRFLRGLRRMFKRRGSGSRVDASPDPKSSSTSELLEAERQARRKEGAYGSGLSVSHDSVFTGERSGDESSDERPTPAHGLAQIASSHRAELVAAVRRRGRGDDDDDDDEDLGLPQSPPASPPTDKTHKRHHAGISQSSCSDGSLLSVGSSEMDEDSSSGHHQSHDHSTRSDPTDYYNSSEPPTGVAPLSHSAARHKMAVRPRRTHGAPRRKKNHAIAATALPITPELNEEMIRSATPEFSQKTSGVVTESLSSSKIAKKELHKVLELPSDAKLKSSSLPPGLALSLLKGQTAAKLSVAEITTPRSSIKRSKSSSQDQSLKNSSYKTQSSVSETHIHHQSESKYSSEKKFAEGSCLEKKSKSEKKIESEPARSSKKEESFFSRWLMRKSGKKMKKDQVDGETQQESKKFKFDKNTPQKFSDLEKSVSNVSELGQAIKPKPPDRHHISAGQIAFSNQMHKRIDNTGAYVQEGVYKETYSASKTTCSDIQIVDHRNTELKDKNLHLEIKNRISRRHEFSEVIERSKKNIQKENKEEIFNTHQTEPKDPTAVQRLVEPFSSVALINQEQSNLQKDSSVSSSSGTIDEQPIRALKINKTSKDILFHDERIPDNKTYFNPNICTLDKSNSNKKKVQESFENVSITNKSDEFSEFREREIIESSKENYHVSKTEECFLSSGLGSLRKDYVEDRSTIGKSQSFRYASETTSINSQESEMPSLPTIFGISEPLLESWEVNYRKSVSDRHDITKRISARNYNIIHANGEDSYDSLPNSDSSYLDSLKPNDDDMKEKFTNSILITVDSCKRNSDISQIEAKIDDIISSPKLMIAPILKSSSLDSIKGCTEKNKEDRRKTISVGTTLNQGEQNTNICFQKPEVKQDTESFISVTHINKEQSPTRVQTIESPKVNKTEEKLHKSVIMKPGVPEFLFLQLNKVDPKPTTHVVLTANITPKKIDSSHDKEREETFLVTETKTNQNMHTRRESSVNRVVETITDISDEKNPLVSNKSIIQPLVTCDTLTSKSFLKKKSSSVEIQEKVVKSRTSSISTDGSNEKICDNLSIDQKSHSSFGSKTSIQSIDSSEIKNPDRNEETVIYRKKPIILSKEIRCEHKNDDEPELMKVFARRSLKIKDSDIENLVQEISDSQSQKADVFDNMTTGKTKILKNEFNASIKSRDSDKENEDTALKSTGENKPIVVATRISQFGNVGQHYQKSVSINSVSSNPKRESAPTFKSDVNKYKKEVSDSTPEKRLRNRTFPDLSNDREDMIAAAKNDAFTFKDTLPKKSWQRRDSEKEKRDSAVIGKDDNKEMDDEKKEKFENAEDDESLRFKCIFERRAEWEKRAKQGMTK